MYDVYDCPVGGEIVLYAYKMIISHGNFTWKEYSDAYVLYGPL